MRLLFVDDDRKLALTRDTPEPKEPYAILSHTWGADEEEVTFADISTGQPYLHKAGYAKLEFCMKQSQKDGLRYFWVDTCCIDKSSTAELSAAITSMFKWYKNARKCYIYLADVPNQKHDREGAPVLTENAALCRSRWFTRGWTLQELLAPQDADFFDRYGKYIGTKRSLANTISQITTVPARVLLAPEELERLSVKEKLAWVQTRNTTLPQDKVYCLAGIFDVPMLVNYGEDQEHALQRLKSAIENKYRTRDLAGMEDFFSVQDPLRQASGVPSVNAAGLLPIDRRKVLMQDLKFDQMDSRQRNIRSEFKSTCAWFMKTSTYKQWLDDRTLPDHRGLLWIKGKPGSGKSTIMKYVTAKHKTARDTPGSNIVISFFFNARGEILERTTVGMYRALLYQILTKVPELQRLLDELEDAEAASLDVEHYANMFTKALSNLVDRPITCFIDALDECKIEEIREMLQTFEDIGSECLEKGVKFRVCFASRHYPTLNIEYGLCSVLEDETGHEEDITKYILGRLRVGTKNETFRSRLQEKANGIFMWVVLVIRILNEEYARGYLPAVEKRFTEIPTDLHELFKEILHRDTDNLQHFRLCLQWTLFAQRPLSSKEFYLAMMAGLDPLNVLDQSLDDVDDNLIERYVSNSSKGLAELTRSRTKRTVQFIHESVRDFLLTEDGLHNLWPAVTNRDNNLVSMAHDELKRCCAAYVARLCDDEVTPALAAAMLPLCDTVVPGSILPTWLLPLSYLGDAAEQTTVLARDAPLPKAGTSLAVAIKQRFTAAFPFAPYAHRYLLYHANEAASSINQNDFLRGFAIKSWIRLHNVFERYEIRRFNTDSGFRHLFENEISWLRYVLADLNCDRLIRNVEGHRYAFVVSGGRYGIPLYAALMHGHYEAACALLPLCDPSIIRGIIQGRSLDVKRPSLSSDIYRSVIQEALYHNNLALVEALSTASSYIEEVHGDDDAHVLGLYDWEAVEPSMAGNQACDSINVALYNILKNAANAGRETEISRLLDIKWFADSLILPKSDGEVFFRPKQKMIYLLAGASEGEHYTAYAKIANHKHFEDRTFDLLRIRLRFAVRSGDPARLRCVLEDLKHPSYDACWRHDAEQPYTWRDIDMAIDIAFQHANEKTRPYMVAILDAFRLSSQPDGATPFQASCFWNAIDTGDVRWLKRSLEEGRDVNQLSPGGFSPLLRSVMCSGKSSVEAQKDIATILIANGADLQSVGPNGQAVLMIASSNAGYGSIVTMLLELGASMSTTDRSGTTALMTAAATPGNHDIVKILLQNKADVKTVDHTGKSALIHASAVVNNGETVQLLLKHGADVGRVDDHGRTALFYACACCSSADNVYSLYKQSKDFHLNLEHVIEDHRTTIGTLLNAGADVNSSDNQGCTCLMATCPDRDGIIFNISERHLPFYRVYWEKTDILEELCRIATHTLLLNGADVNLEDVSGKTAFMRFKSSGYVWDINGTPPDVVPPDVVSIEIHHDSQSDVESDERRPISK